MTDRRRLALLILTIVAATVAYGVGNGSVALWDRDEPRFAETSRQMLTSGNWVVPYFLDQRRTAKPPLIYWAQAAAMRVVGAYGDAGNFAARLPSTVAIAALLVVLSTVLWRPLGSQRAMWTVVIFATSGLTFAAAKMCITDAVLLVWVTVAQLCLYAAWRGRATWPVVLTWAVMVGLAGLTKGPVIFGMQAVTLVALGVMRLVERRWPPTPLADATDPLPSVTRRAWLKVIVGTLVVAAIVAPWIVMVNHRSEGFIQAAFNHEVKDRMLTPLEQHYGPPGYYFATVWATFFPWSLLLPLAIGLGWHRRADARSRFALAAVVGPWLLLEPVRTKLPHYFLPAFPPLAYLTADALVRCLNGEIDDLRGKAFKVVVSVWAVVIAAVASAPWLAVGRYPSLPVGWMAALSVGGLVFAGTTAGLVWRERLGAAAAWMAGGTVGLILLIFGGYLPRADFFRLSPRVARVLVDHGVTGPGQCIMLDYKEPSLAWAQGGTMREAERLWFSRKFDPQLPPWLVMTADLWQQAPADLRAEFDVVSDQYGWAYADRGRWVHVLVVHRR